MTTDRCRLAEAVVTDNGALLEVIESRDDSHSADHPCRACISPVLQLGIFPESGRNLPVDHEERGIPCFPGSHAVGFFRLPDVTRLLSQNSEAGPGLFPAPLLFRSLFHGYLWRHHR